MAMMAMTTNSSIRVNPCRRARGGDEEQSEANTKFFIKSLGRFFVFQFRQKDIRFNERRQPIRSMRKQPTRACRKPVSQNHACRSHWFCLSLAVWQKTSHLETVRLTAHPPFFTKGVVRTHLWRGEGSRRRSARIFRLSFEVHRVLPHSKRAPLLPVNRALTSRAESVFVE